MNKGSAAFVAISLETAEDVSLSFSTSSNVLDCYWSPWYFNGKDIILYIFADSVCYNQTITIYVTEYPSISLDISVTVGKDVTIPTYYPFPTVPDLGYYAGVPILGRVYSTDPNSITFGVTYDASDLSKTRFTKPKSLRDFYFDLLTQQYGFIYIRYNGSNDKEVYWEFRNQKSGITLHYIEYSNDGDTVSKVGIVWKLE